MRVLFAVLSCVVACSSSEPSPERDADTDEPGGERADAGSTSECADEGSTRACTCTGGAPGRKTCRKGKYSACGSCVEVRKDGGAPASSGDKCRAGYYTGQIMGDYKPGFASLGLGESLLEVQFRGMELNGKPALSLTLTENATGPAGEFYTFTVNGGCMQGLAHSGQTDTPFVARVTGDLDCGSGAFNGVMEGYYTLVGLQGLNYTFKGPITAQFVTSDSTLQDGEWQVKEPNALNGQPQGGGSGVWSAKWTAMDAPDAGGSDPCRDVVTTGPLDAGVDASR